MTIATSTAANQAARIAATLSDRGQTYGAPEDGFGHAAALWNVWIAARHDTVVELDAADVGVMVALLKLSRLAETPTHADSALDAAAYVLLAQGCAVAAEQVAA